MAFFSVDAIVPLVNMGMAVLFAGTLYFLARLHGRVVAMRGAQSELRGLLRACSDAVDGAEQSILALRQAAQTLAGDLGRSMDEAEKLRAEIDRTCGAARQMLDRLGPLTAPPAPGGVDEVPARAPIAGAAPDIQPSAASADRPPAGSTRVTAAPAERAAMRLFRETLRGL